MPEHLKIWYNKNIRAAKILATTPLSNGGREKPYWWERSEKCPAARWKQGNTGIWDDSSRPHKSDSKSSAWWKLKTSGNSWRTADFQYDRNNCMLETPLRKPDLNLVGTWTHHRQMVPCPGWIMDYWKYCEINWSCAYSNLYSWPMGQSFILDPSDCIKQGQLHPSTAGKLKVAAIK